MARVAPLHLKAFVSDLLVAGGADPDEAALVADVMIWADRRQRYPQGCVWTDTLLARLETGALRSPTPLSVLAETPATALLDAHDGFGQVAAIRAADDAVERARATGVGLVAIRNSTHFGPAGYYAARIAAAGCLGLAMTNAYPKVAAHGGRRAALGTNPLAFSVPADRPGGIIGDLSTGALAGSRVREAIELGRPLPEGMALDAAGEPTTDPVALERGGVMLPAGGAKGFALGLLVELFTAVLAGGPAGLEVGSVFDPTAGPRVSHVLIAVAPFDSDYAARAGRLLEQVVSLDEDAAVRVPGAHREDLATQADAQGIELPADSERRLRRAAERLDVQFPPRFAD
jgi:LDH2 family malate/lactate/ureidoglycolate dehydrogenase